MHNYFQFSEHLAFQTFVIQFPVVKAITKIGVGRQNLSPAQCSKIPQKLFFDNICIENLHSIFGVKIQTFELVKYRIDVTFGSKPNMRHF